MKEVNTDTKNKIGKGTSRSTRATAAELMNEQDTASTATVTMTRTKSKLMQDKAKQDGKLQVFQEQ